MWKYFSNSPTVFRDVKENDIKKKNENEQNTLQVFKIVSQFFRYNSVTKQNFK